MPLLRPGSKGPDVELLQLKLKAAGYDPGDVDGDFGPKTADAVLEFQKDRPDLEDDGIAGPSTDGALDAAIVRRAQAGTPPRSSATATVPCNATTWDRFQNDFITPITRYPVRYGPGRGLWSDKDKRFIITYGAGTLKGTTKLWPNVLSRTYPSLHCTSFTNLFLSWLTRRNQDFTHAGNIPSLFDLAEQSSALHQNPGAGSWRGFGDVCLAITPDGSGAKRSGVSKVVDAREIYDRRDSLPTFCVFAQSTKINGKWLWWHHTGLWVCYGGKLSRIAADGYKGVNGYSANPMQWVEVTDKDVAKYAAAIYRIYGVTPHADGSYGDLSRPMASIDFET